MSDRSISTQSVHAFPAAALRTLGQERSERGFRPSTGWKLRNTYRLDHAFARGRLSLETTSQNGLRIAQNTKLGQPGADLAADCNLTFQSPEGQTHDAVQLIERDAQGQTVATYIVPFLNLHPQTAYTLVDIDQHAARGWMTRMPCLYFANGTHITLSSGERRRIEEVRVGDRVHTQDAGPQDIRWVGSATMPARGEFAPVLIEAGALTNENNLLVGPNHRLFVSPRRGGFGVDDADLMVKARHLVNGNTIRLQPGPNMECTQILFDRHHRVFAEGIATEATLMQSRAKPSLPPELVDRLKGLMPGRKGSKRTGFDVQQALLNRPDAFDLILRASAR